MDTYASVFSAIVDLLVLIVGVVLFFCYERRIKTHELATNYRAEMLPWYSQAVERMILMMHLIKSNNFNEREMTEHLAALSALVETGRFFFPNVNWNNRELGRHKLVAFQEYRSIQLEFLMWFYIMAREFNTAL